MTDRILYANPWLSLRAIEGNASPAGGSYVYSQETRCRGRIVAVLPFRRDRDPAVQTQFLLREEITPCWSLEPVLGAVTGGWEGGDIADDAVRELHEETGYVVDKDQLIELGTSYASKSSDTVYSLFAVDLSGLEPQEQLDDFGRGVWANCDELSEVRDPQVSVMYTRLLLRRN
jgi:8-oxo-dGTP pyrophosphatase MutT (NUDIX family)